MNFESLTLSGGSIRGFALLGALQYLSENKLLDHLKYFAGTSVGAIICFLTMIGYTGTEIMVYVCSNHIVEKISNKINNITDTLTKKGLYDYSMIEETLRNLIMEKIGYIPTMKDIFKKLHKIFIITTYNLTKQRKIYITYRNFPNLSVLDALHMSCNLPFIFSEFMYQDCDYIDGGFVDNFPIDAFTICPSISKHKKLGINLAMQHAKPVTSFVDKLYSILFIPIIEREKDKIKKHCHDVIINIKTDVFSPLFEINNSQKLDLFSTGYNAAKNTFT